MSTEHEVSLRSARFVLDAIDRDRYRPMPIVIDRRGRWHSTDDSLSMPGGVSPIALTMDVPPLLVSLEPCRVIGSIDALFPMLHGSPGEDGSIQGLAKLIDLPCVGADILGSALAIDKEVSKRLLVDGGIGIAPFVAFDDVDIALAGYESLVDALGARLMVKPVSHGSSIGVSCATERRSYEAAVRMAFSYDTRILVEQYIEGRELEISVIGNRFLQASLPGEIIVVDDIYSYEQKYAEHSSARLEAPARLPQSLIDNLQATAVQACQLLHIRGMARVDFFLTTDDRILVNEVNTIPGFTDISMYPKLLDIYGISATELVERLIRLAFESHREARRLSFTIQQTTDRISGDDGSH